MVGRLWGVNGPGLLADYFNDVTLAIDWNDIVPVPEPMSGARLLMGGIAVLLRRRCRA
jgi:hypothetical protein